MTWKYIHVLIIFEAIAEEGSIIISYKNNTMSSYAAYNACCESIISAFEIKYGD